MENAVDSVPINLALLLSRIFFNFNAPYLVMKKTILGFCGFKPIKTTHIGGVKNLNQKEREKILVTVTELGLAGK